MSLGFERSEAFSFDKPTDSACRHLLASNRCAVHATRAERGLLGCVGFDCYGAGQRVSQELFPGRSWRDHPELGAQMFVAFRALYAVHELVLLLRIAEHFELPPDAAERRRALLARLEPDAGFSAATLAAFDVEARGHEVRAFLRGLRDVVAPWRRRLPMLE